jgi:hypothetical protein
MAIEWNKRNKILAGVAGVVVVAAAAWFLFLEDFLSEPPPKPAAAVPAKPAASVANPSAASAKPAAAKPAAAAAKPIPTNPDLLVAEVIESSGLRQSVLLMARELAIRAVADDATGSTPEPDAVAAGAAAARQFEAGPFVAEVSAALKTNLDAERMARFLELLRDPAVAKMVAREAAGSTPDGLREAVEAARKSPPAANRIKQVQALDDLTHRSEVGADLANGMARAMVDAMLEAMRKAPKSVPAEARQAVGARLNAIRSQARPEIRTVMAAAYRDATDEEFAAYLKVLDADSGRWGMDRLAEAIRPVLMSRAGQIGKDIAPIALSRRTAAVARAPVAEPDPLPKAAIAAPAAAPAAAAPVEPPGYQRPANVKELYTRYNDLVTATVMRDPAAVRELLADGKSPNLRQSDGSTPLMIAAGNGDTEIAGMLLAKGADPNARAFGGGTALSIAKSLGAAGAPMVQLLQRGGARE